MSNHMVKFQDFNLENLEGYGFDVAADRVVKFTKHAEGVYLNTRSSYSINRGKYTHYELRQIALKYLNQVEPIVQKQKSSKRWIWITLAIIMLCSITTCSVDFNLAVKPANVEHED